MADVALVHLALDSSGVVAGEKQATAALQAVERAMGQVEKTFARFNQSIESKAKASGEAIAKSTRSVGGMSSALSSLGGPVGRFASEMSNVVGQAEALSGAFGALAAAGVGVVAAVAAAGAAIVNLTLDGVKLNTQLADLATGLGFTADQMERLNAAAKLSGEDVGVVDRAFASFQGAIKTAISDPASDANNALRKLGVDAKIAVKDTQGAFLDLLRQLNGVTGSFDKMSAARELFSRSTSSLIRISEEFNRVMGLTTEQMEALGLSTNEASRKASAETARALNEMSLKWENFKRSLAEDWGPVIIKTLALIAQGAKDAREATKGAFTIGGGGLPRAGFAFTSTQLGRLFTPSPTHPQLGGLFDLGQSRPTEKPTGDAGSLPPIAKVTKGAEKAVQLAATASELAEATRATKEFFDAWKSVTQASYDAQLISFEKFSADMTRFDEAMRNAQIANAKGIVAALEAQLSKLKPGTDNFKAVETALSKVREEATKLGNALGIVVLPEIEKLLAVIRGVQFSILPNTTIAPLRGRPGREAFPLAGRLAVAPNPDDIQVERGVTRPRIVAETLPSRPRRVKGERDPALEEIDAQFEAIFDGFLVSILAAQRTVGEAFQTAAFAVADQLLSEFEIAMRKAFIDPLIKSLTDLLQGAINKLVSGLSIGNAGGNLLGAVGGLFNSKAVSDGVTKGLSSVLGKISFFAEGGVLGAGKFGVVGERGPELVFSGAHPVTVSPLTYGGSATYNVNVGVNAPSGQVDKRTRDQLAATVLGAVRRAQRNEGSR